MKRFQEFSIKLDSGTGNYWMKMRFVGEEKVYETIMGNGLSDEIAKALDKMADRSDKMHTSLPYFNLLRKI